MLSSKNYLFDTRIIEFSRQLMKSQLFRIFRRCVEISYFLDRLFVLSHILLHLAPILVKNKDEKLNQEKLTKCNIRYAKSGDIKSIS